MSKRSSAKCVFLSMQHNHRPRSLPLPGGILQIISVFLLGRRLRASPSSRLWGVEKGLAFRTAHTLSLLRLDASGHAIRSNCIYSPDTHQSTEDQCDNAFGGESVTGVSIRGRVGRDVMLTQLAVQVVGHSLQSDPRSSWCFQRHFRRLGYRRPCRYRDVLAGSLGPFADLTALRRMLRSSRK